MPFWRREEPLHERLAREGGLAFGPRPDIPGVQQVQRERRWDAVVAVDAEGPEDAAELAFVALADGTLLAEDDVSAEELEPFTEALDERVEPPFRVQAVRRGERRWVAAGRRIEVVKLSEEVAGEEISIAVRGGERTFLVDGVERLGRVTELERLASARGLDAYVVQAERLDGDLWEVRLAAL